MVQAMLERDICTSNPKAYDAVAAVDAQYVLKASENRW
jgi:hypothetical protein